MQTVYGNRSAFGTITFADNPTANDTITINGTVYTFVASGATTYQINIGVDLETTIDNTVTKLNASAVAAVALATYAKSGTTILTITYDAAGSAGNAFHPGGFGGHRISSSSGRRLLGRHLEPGAEFGVLSYDHRRRSSCGGSFHLA